MAPTIAFVKSSESLARLHSRHSSGTRLKRGSGPQQSSLASQRSQGQSVRHRAGPRSSLRRNSEGPRSSDEGSHCSSSLNAQSIHPSATVTEVPEGSSFDPLHANFQDDSCILGAERPENGPGSVLGAIALITGTSVGAGMLALPSETAPAGFMPSAALLVGCWAFLTMEAFLIADVNISLLQRRKEQRQQGVREQTSLNSTTPSEDTSASDFISLRTMAEETLGPVGGWISTAAYVFLSYTLMVAYVAKSADVLTLGTDIPVDVASGLFVLALGGMVYAGTTETTDWVNRVMTGALLGLFGLIVTGGAFSADWSQLSSQDWSQASGTLPVLFLSLVFHDLIPVLCTYLEGDLKRVRTAIAIGGAVPLVMFLIWDALALSLAAGSGSADPLEAIMRLGGTGQAMLIEGFSLLAIMTSFIGTALSFSEFFMEQLGAVLPQGLGSFRGLGPLKVFNPLHRLHSKMEAAEAPRSEGGRAGTASKEGGFAGILVSRKQIIRAAAFAIVLLPSWLVSCSIPDAFFTASEVAGAYGMTVLYGIFPPLMFWRMHQAEMEKQEMGEGEVSLWNKPAGNFALASMAAGAFSVIVSQAALDLNGADQSGATASGPATSASSVVVLASTTPIANAVKTGSAHVTAQQSLTAPLAVDELSKDSSPRRA